MICDHSLKSQEVISEKQKRPSLTAVYPSTILGFQQPLNTNNFSESVKVFKIMPNDIPMGVIVLGGSFPSNYPKW